MIVNKYAKLILHLVETRTSYLLYVFLFRYAITVWYIDETEKKDFEEKKKIDPKKEET